MDEFLFIKSNRKNLYLIHCRNNFPKTTLAVKLLRWNTKYYIIVCVPPPSVNKNFLWQTKRCVESSGAQILHWTELSVRSRCALSEGFVSIRKLSEGVILAFSLCYSTLQYFLGVLRTLHFLTFSISFHRIFLFDYSKSRNRFFNRPRLRSLLGFVSALKVFDKCFHCFDLYSNLSFRFFEFMFVINELFL